MGTAGRVANVGDIGIVPRFINDVFERKRKIESQFPGSEIIIRCSFVEIYGEQVRDLLEMDRSTTKEVIVRSDQQGQVKVIGQKVQEVTSEEELLELLDNGSLYRVTGETSMNAFSSRSHAIFTIYIDQDIVRPASSEDQDNNDHDHDNDNNNNNNKGKNDDKNEDSPAKTQSDSRQSKFHFVDLAGSERLARTHCEGKQQSEGININQGLLVLGKVIRALGDEKHKGG